VDRDSPQPWRTRFGRAPWPRCVCLTPPVRHAYSAEPTPPKSRESGRRLEAAGWKSRGGDGGSLHALSMSKGSLPAVSLSNSSKGSLSKESRGGDVQPRRLPPARRPSRRVIAARPVGWQSRPPDCWPSTAAPGRLDEGPFAAPRRSAADGSTPRLAWTRAWPGRLAWSTPSPPREASRSVRPPASGSPRLRGGRPRRLSRGR